MRIGFAASMLAAFLFIGALFGARAAMAEQSISILVYHRFDPVKAGPTTVTTPDFEQQLDWLDTHHYQIVPLRSAIAALLKTGPAVGEPAIAITADDGHVSVYTQLYPIVRRRHLPVTLFIYPSAISNASYALTWDQLAEMVQSGLVEVQSHTYWHPDFRKERAHRTPEDYRAFVDFQLVRSKAVLERRLGVRIDMLAWPFGIVDAELEAAAARAGYQAAFAYAGGAAREGVDPFAIPRIPVSDHARGAAFQALFPQTSTRKPGS